MPKAHVMPGSRLPIPEWLELDSKTPPPGGKGIVYFTTDSCYAVKIIHKPTQEKLLALKQILELGNELGEDEQFLAWPLAIVDKIDNKPCLGVVSRKANNCTELYRMIFSPVDALNQFREGRTWLDFVKIARGTAAAVRAVHGKGIVHGDVQFRNFLANPVTAEVVMIDMDGMIVPGFLKPEVAGVSGFIAPEVVMRQNQPDKYSELHSLAVLILWILLLRNVMLPQKCYDPEDQVNDDMLSYGKEACFSENENDRRNYPDRLGMPIFRKGLLSYTALPPELQVLTKRALVDNLFTPKQRPMAREWEVALANVYDTLITCQNAECTQAFFYPYWQTPPGRRKCPFCGSPVKAPFPAVLDLYQEKVSGHPTCIRKLVLYQGLPIFDDIPEIDVLPPFTRRSSTRIGLTRFHPVDKIYYLTNESNIPWRMLSGGSGYIGKGQSIALRPGVAFSFGTGKRYCRVIE